MKDQPQDQPQRRKFLGAALVAASGGLLSAGEGSAKSEAPTGGPQGLFLPVLEGDCEFGRQFVEDPVGTLRRLGRGVESLPCPREAHDAWDRARQLEAEAVPVLNQAANPLDLIARLRRLAPAHFGEDY